MRKVWTCMVITAVCAVLLSACTWGNNGNDDTTTDGVSATETTTAEALTETQTA